MHRTIHSTMKDAHNKYKESTQMLQEKTPNTDQALKLLQDYANTYVAWIPGGRGLIDTTFKKINKLRDGHGQEIDEIVGETYQELQQISREGLSMQTLQHTAEALNKFAKRIGSVAGDSIGEILDDYPQIRDTIGQPVQQLRQMSESMGPEVKKEVDQTWDQIKELMQGGLTAGTAAKAYSLLQEKTQKIREMGNESWKKGMEKAKPMLEKNPKLKELLEKNESALKQGNAQELFQKVSESINSGNTSDLEGYVKQTVDKTKNQASGMSLGGLEKYAQMIPGGSEIMQKISQIEEVATKHRSEGEKLLKETLNEIQKVVAKQSDKAKDLVENAKRESK